MIVDAMGSENTVFFCSFRQLPLKNLNFTNFSHTFENTLRNIFSRHFFENWDILKGTKLSLHCT